MVTKLFLFLSNEMVLLFSFVVSFILNFFGYIANSSLLYVLLKLLVISIVFRLLYNFISTTLLISDLQKKKNNKNDRS